MNQNLSTDETKTVEDIVKAMEGKFPYGAVKESENRYTKLTTSGKTSYGNDAYILIERSNFARDIDGDNVAGLWVILNTFSPRGPWNMAGRLSQLSDIFENFFGSIDEVDLGLTGYIFNNKKRREGIIGDFTANARFKHVDVSCMLTPEDVLSFADNVDNMVQAAELAESGLPPNMKCRIDGIKEGHPMYLAMQKVISSIDDPTVKSALGVNNGLIVRTMIEAYSTIRAETVQMEESHGLKPGEYIAYYIPKEELTGGDLYCVTDFSFSSFKRLFRGNRTHINVLFKETDYPPFSPLTRDTAGLPFYEQAPYTAYTLMFRLAALPELNTEEQQHFLSSANEAYKKIFGIDLLNKQYQASQKKFPADPWLMSPASFG